MKGVVVAVFLVLAVAFSAVERGHAAATCSDFKTPLTPCTPFVIGLEPQPSEACCNGLRSAVSLVKSTEDKRSVCECVKGATGQLPGLIDKITTGSSKCGVALPFPVTKDMDCNKIQ